MSCEPPPLSAALSDASEVLATWEFSSSVPVILPMAANRDSTGLQGTCWVPLQRDPGAPWHFAEVIALHGVLLAMGQLPALELRKSAACRLRSCIRARSDLGAELRGSSSMPMKGSCRTDLSSPADWPTGNHSGSTASGVQPGAAMQGCSAPFACLGPSWEPVTASASSFNGSLGWRIGCGPLPLVSWVDATLPPPTLPLVASAMLASGMRLPGHPAPSKDPRAACCAS
mmetsp:Transcript_75418/g.244017  ORF Transcript_75418/g.244017 Transcript_75418/m.244017 type:complete len:229 (+) Transcript_75418:889-1575(+)